MPTLCTVFYSIGRVYRFGFGCPGFLRKCLSKMCGGKADREGLGVVPGKRCGFHVVMGKYPEKLLVNCGGGVLQVTK